MKNLSVYLSLVVGLLTGLSAEAEYLWWVVDEPSVTYTDAEGSHSTGTENFWIHTEDGMMFITDARVRVHNETAGVDEYLMIGYSEHPYVYPSHDFTDDGTPKLPITMAGPVFAVIVPGEYASEGYSFAIELGNWQNWEDPSSWTVMATSGFTTYADIAKYIVENKTEVPISEYWNPNQFTAVGGAIPEPTSGVLVLIGAGLMALRRRRG